MTPADLAAFAIEPALALLGRDTRLPDPGNKALVLLTAIALQESDLRWRRQAGGGPARSFWQFEAPTLTLLKNNGTTQRRLRILLTDLAIDPARLFDAIEFHDIAAAGCARLLLLPDPAPLPQVGDADAAWDYYIRVWRPGKPRPADWAANYAKAVAG